MKSACSDGDGATYAEPLFDTTDNEHPFTRDNPKGLFEFRVQMRPDNRFARIGREVDFEQLAICFVPCAHEGKSLASDGVGDGLTGVGHDARA